MTGFSLHVCTVSFPTAILQTGSEKGALGLEWLPFVSTGPFSCSPANTTLIPDAVVEFPLLAEGPLKGGTRLGRETTGKVRIPSAVTHHVSDAAHTSHAIIGNCCAIMQYVKTCVCDALHLGRGVNRHHYCSGWM